MKTPPLFTILFLSMALAGRAQQLTTPPQTAPQPADIPYAVTARTAHTSLWQSTTWELTPSGQWEPKIQQYMETATGLNFFEDATGTWQPSSADIEPVQSGAAAVNGQHKVTFAADLATIGAINIQMPDGQQLNSQLIGLRYFDEASGQSAFIATVTNSIGEIVGNNQVWYENAFAGLQASVRYTYTISSFSQDIVMEQCPQPPEAYGLSSSSTVLQAVTEFLSPPTASVSTQPITFAAAGQMMDQTINFPMMCIGPGRAFLIGDNDTTGVPVSKQWTNWDGYQVLIEQIPMAQIAPQLQTLPYAQTASLKSTRLASLKAVLAHRPATRTESKPMKLASLRTRRPGFDWDFTTFNSSQTNCVFQGDLTYFLSGNVILVGTNTTFEGSTVLKFATNVTLTVDTPVTWLGQPYRPVVMLSKDDNTVGQSISGATGNPGNNYYATVALNFNGTSALTNLTIESLRVLNAQTAVALNGQSGNALTDVQIAKCGNGIAATNTDFTLRNALMSFVQTNFNGNTATGAVEHLTSDSALWLNQNITNLFLTNCLLTAVTNASAYTQQSGTNLSSNAGVYQTVGAASYYLAGNSPYRNAGTTNLDSVMLADLQQTTTYPPLVYSNATFSTNTEFGPQAQRDYDTPDLGYHYAPLDWVFGGATADANFIFDAGTAVGYFETASGDFGIQLSNDTTNTFNGTVTAPCVFARYSTVQEGNGTWQNKGTLAGITTVGNSSYFGEISARFLHCYGFNYDPNHIRDYYAKLDVHANDCEFNSANMAGYYLGTFMTNCLFDRVSYVGSEQQSDGLYWRNCTMHGGIVFALHSTNPYWPVWIENCAFDDSSTDMDNNAGGNTNITYCNFNGFVNGAQRLIVLGTNDVVTNTFTWQTGPLGNWYQPTNSPFINAGSVPASVVGLYHFTTQTNETVEGDSIVDIGYHYVALDSNGNPLDTNGDGIPDYLEDSNGDGIYDAGDLGNWLINPYNGLSLTNGLTVFTPLK